jgi:hypothetical protein
MNIEIFHIAGYYIYKGKENEVELTSASIIMPMTFDTLQKCVDYVYERIIRAERRSFRNRIKEYFENISDKIIGDFK